MLKSLAFSFTLVFLCISQISFASAGKYPIQHFTPSMYQAGNQNIDFAQNRDMTLFVANNLGVLSFNGHSWGKHAFRTGKKKRSLAFDKSSNRLYMGSQGDFGYFEGNWNYISLIHLIPEDKRDFDEVWDVYILNSEIFFCTFQGIFVYDGDTIRVIRKEGGLDKSFVANDNLYSQNPQGRLFQLESDGFSEPFKQGDINQVIRGIVPYNEGLLLFYNSGSIELSSALEARPIFKSLANELEGSFVNHVQQLSDSRIAISTQTSGLFIFDLYSQSVENISTTDGLSTNTCLRSFQDFEGNLWLGLQNGIALIHINSPIRLINQEIKLQGSGYSALETNDGVYYSTSNGIYYRRNNQDECTFLKGTEGPAYGIGIINDAIYAGHHTGLFLLQNATATRVASTEGLWSIKRLKQHPEYAVGGGYSGIHLFKISSSGILNYVRKMEGFVESSRFIEEDQKGDLWIGQYYKGLYQLTLSEDLEIIESTKLPDNNLKENEQIILSRVDNQLMLASNKGVSMVDPVQRNMVQAQPFSEILGDQQVYLFEQDKQKNVHVVADRVVGFFKQLSANNYVFIPSSLYYMRYFLNNDLLNISTHINEGVMFASNEGFIYYDSKLENQVSLDHPVVIRSVINSQADTALYKFEPFMPIPSEGESFSINYSQRNLAFEVESFQFNGIYNQQFRYFLNGFDEDYGEWTESSLKEYSNLREGDYEFFVQSQNYMGEVTTSLPLKFTISPPFYRSIFARSLYLVFSIIGLLLLYRLQSLRYRKKTKQLRLKTQSDLDKQQKRLKDFEEESSRKLSRLKQENLENELRHTSNLLAASTMNLVVKNEFIESIKDELQKAKSLGRNADTKKALESIVREIDITLRLQEDWEHFELHFDQVHGDFSSRLREEFIDLSPNEQKLCTLLRLNLSTKEIANLMSISQRGVEVARYRLRKKLQLRKGQNLSKFILQY